MINNFSKTQIKKIIIVIFEGVGGQPPIGVVGHPQEFSFIYLFLSLRELKK
jgi:hypothetical protein